MNALMTLDPPGAAIRLFVPPAIELATVPSPTSQLQSVAFGLADGPVRFEHPPRIEPHVSVAALVAPPLSDDATPIATFLSPPLILAPLAVALFRRPPEMDSVPGLVQFNVGTVPAPARS